MNSSLLFDSKDKNSKLVLMKICQMPSVLPQGCDYYWVEQTNSDAVTISTDIVNRSDPSQSIGFSGSHNELIIFERLHSRLHVHQCPNGEGHINYSSNFLEHGLKTPLKKHSINYDNLVSALCIFKEIYGHINVPVGFTIQPQSIIFPFGCEGLELGPIMQLLRSDVLLVIPGSQTQLEELGLVFHKCPPVDLLSAAIAAYLRTCDVKNINFKYIVPRGSSYDRCLWGCELGQLMQLICDGSLYAEHKEKWLALKLPLKTRQLEDRRKRKIQYDATDYDAALSKAIKSLRRPKEQATIRVPVKEEALGWLNHKLISNSSMQCSSVIQSRCNLPADDDDLVSIGSSDDIMDEIEAYPFLSDSSKVCVAISHLCLFNI